MEDAPASREQRKTVTVLFCDVTGSTALGESTDPEALRALLARYFERMKGIIESHGGTVEKFIGDAVMAVFGVPQVHEDDALRACRAAVEMRDALPELGVQARIGLNTGEVVTGTEERLATGDAVNVAARLEQAAQPGEILIGEDDARARPRRGRDRGGRAARAEGKGGARSGAPARRRPRGAGAPARDALRRQVGRAGDACRQAWQRALEERRCELVTVVGDAGVGKSRLAAEFLASVEAPIVARPLPALRRGDHLLAGGRGAEAAGRASLRSGRSGLAPLLLGETDEGTSAEEIAWAFRKLLEEQARRSSACSTTSSGARRRSSTWSKGSPCSPRDAPILLLCMARPDCASAGRSGRSAPARAARRGRRGLAAPGAIRRGAARADRSCGRRQPALHHRDGGDGPRDRAARSTVPPNLQALLAARLDQLETRGARRARAWRRRRARSSTAARSRRSLPRSAHGDAAPGRARPQGADPSRHARGSRPRTPSASATC